MFSKNHFPTLSGGNGHKALIHLNGLSKSYYSEAGEFTALKGIDLEIGPGEFISIVGKSGSGKTTLINMIAGIDRPTAGEIWVGGTAVHSLSEGQMAVWRGRNIGIVFQFFQLLPTLVDPRKCDAADGFQRSLRTPPAQGAGPIPARPGRHRRSRL